MRDNSTDALAVAAATAVRRFVCVLRRALGKTTKRATPKIITKPMTLFSSGLSYCYWLLLPAFSFVFTWDSRLLLLCCFVSVLSLFAYKPSRLWWLKGKREGNRKKNKRRKEESVNTRLFVNFWRCTTILSDRTMRPRYAVCCPRDEYMREMVD